MEQLKGLPLGRQLILGAGVLLFIDTLLHWQQVNFGSISAGRNAWHGFWGFLMCLMVIALVLWTAARAFNVALPAQVPDGLATLALGVLIPVFALLKAITDELRPLARMARRDPRRGDRVRRLAGVRGERREAAVDACARHDRVALAPGTRYPTGYLVPASRLVCVSLKVAVVGSGPAGFYTADALLKSEDPQVAVDLLDRLPTPWGLVRLGVAPDHENIKAVSRAFEKTAARPGFRFFGNVEVGSTVSHEELLSIYDAVVYTVGAQTDRRLGIPGEDLPGSWPATAFVAWYNGHPDFQDLAFDLGCERVVVIGNGNVAIDCARMLALTAEELAPTDTIDDAAEAIAASPVREILMLGRRGRCRRRSRRRS